MYPSTTPFYGNQFNQGNYGFTPQVPNVQPKQEIKRVHGRPGAEAFYLGPNESALLLDDTGPIVWFKATDSAAMGQKIIDMFAGNRMADMQNQINMLQLQNAMAGVVRYPMASTYSSGNNPFCGQCCPGMA